MVKKLTKAERKVASSKKKQIRQIVYNENSKNVSIIAIDTNLFIFLAQIDENGVADKGKEGYKQSIRDIKRLVKSGHLKCVLLPTVVEEILPKLKFEEKVFMEKYCYVLDSVHIPGFEDFIKDFALDLASYELVNNKRASRMLDDSKIAAESMYFGLALCTGNTKDFIVYDKYAKFINKDARAGAIAKYGKTYLTKHNIIPNKHITPLTPAQFLGTFKTIRYFNNLKLYKATMQNLIDYVGPEHVMFEHPDDWYEREFDV